MTESRNSLILGVGLVALAAAIVFHAWWPSYKADRNLEEYVVDCMPINLLGQKESVPLSDIPEKGGDILDEARRKYGAVIPAEKHWTAKRKKCVKEYYFIFSDRMR